LGGAQDSRQQYLSDGLHLSSRGNQRVFELLSEGLSASLPSWMPDSLPMDQKQWFEQAAAPSR
jgi:hypothetical protein